MDLSLFLKKRVVINLLIGWVYHGIVLDAEKDSLTLRDKKGELVYLNKEAIQSIRESNVSW